MPSSVFGGDAALAANMEGVRQELSVSDENLRRVVKILREEMRRELRNSSFGMLPTHVNFVPGLIKIGRYLAIDLGGTNFRLLLIHIKDQSNIGNNRIQIVTEVFALPEDVLIDGRSFFDHIAKCMALFCKLNEISNTGDPIPVGFTFSFPLRQEHLSHAVLIDWAKGFEVNGVIGNDVVEMLLESLRKRDDVNCEIVAVINDTVATLVSCAHDDPTCKIGLIVGTGCNACYMEETKNIAGAQDKEGQMCINMEWGSFGGGGILDEFRNEYDRAVDMTSKNPNRRVYEKMICGRYLGELVRLVLCKFTSKGVLFSGQTPQGLFTEHSFLTSYVYQIESVEANHNFGPYLTIRNILSTFGVTADDTDCEMVRQICHLVSTRAAHLCAAGVAAVALKIRSNHPERERMTITVAVDGTIYKKHPTFGALLRDKVNELCDGRGLEIKFLSSYDGSGKGAALVAAALNGRNSPLPTSSLNNGLILP